MSKKEGKNELTPQQEMFCRYVVDAYGNNPNGVLVVAYRKAYNAEKGNSNTHYKEASKLMDNPKIKQRIEQLRESMNCKRNIERVAFENLMASIIVADPLDLYEVDNDTEEERPRKLWEIPKALRKMLSVGHHQGQPFYYFDKEAAYKRLMQSKGFDKPEFDPMGAWG